MAVTVLVWIVASCDIATNREHEQVLKQRNGGSRGAVFVRACEHHIDSVPRPKQALEINRAPIERNRAHAILDEAREHATMIAKLREITPKQGLIRLEA